MWGQSAGYGDVQVRWRREGSSFTGTTLIVAELRWEGSGPRTVLWRTTDRTWATFEKLAALPGTYAELRTSRTAVWTYRVPDDHEPEREVGPLLRIDLTGAVQRVDQHRSHPVPRLVRACLTGQPDL